MSEPTKPMTAFPCALGWEGGDCPICTDVNGRSLHLVSPREGGEGTLTCDRCGGTYARPRPRREGECEAREKREEGST